MIELREEEKNRLNSEIEILKGIIGIDGPIEKKVEALDGIIRIHKNYSYHSHDERVSEISACIAERLGLVKGDAERIRQAGLLHDIGKIGVEKGVMEKNGPLTEEEREKRTRHPVYGDYILRALGLEELAFGAHYHHERADGKGYPDGLDEGNSEFIYWIIAFADTYDAMKSNRYYRSVWMNDEIITEEVKRVSMLDFDKGLLESYIRTKLGKLGRDKERLKQKISYYNRFFKKPEYMIDSLQGKDAEELEKIYMKQRLSFEKQLNKEITNRFLELRMEDLQKIRERHPDPNEIFH